MVIFIDNSD